MRNVFLSSVAMIAVAATAQMGHAQVIIAELSEQTLPTNPANGYGGFTFDDFSEPGAVTYTADSIILDIAVDSDGSNGLFGGVGVDFGVPTTIAGIDLLLPIDYDASTSWWELRVKKLAGNAATVVNTTLKDNDDILTSAAEEYQFNFDLTGVPDDGEFHLITIPGDVFGFRQDSSGSPDEVLNPGLSQLQFQSAYGSDNRLHIEIDYARILTVPEPTSVALIGLGFLGWIGARRR